MKTVELPLPDGKAVKFAELRPADHWEFTDRVRSERMTRFSQLCYANKVQPAEFGKGAAAIMAERIDMATELQSLPGQMLLLWLSAKRADPKVGTLEAFRLLIPDQEWMTQAFLSMQSLAVREGQNVDREDRGPLGKPTGPES